MNSDDLHVRTVTTVETGDVAPLLHGYRGVPGAIALALVAGVVSLCLRPLQASELADPTGPFVLGEGYPEVPADCRTIEHWIEHAPDTDDRISLAIEGELTVVEWHDPVAYLVMCDESAVQVLCVTYGVNGMQTGDVVLFGGGYTRAGKRKIMLDPCLAN